MNNQFNFNRSKSFYPLITNYWITLFGAKEISAFELYKRYFQDFIDKGGNQRALDEIVEEAKTDAQKEIIKRLFTNPPTEYLIKLNLLLKCDNTRIEFDTGLLSKEFIDNFDYLGRFTMRAAGVLLLLAYETTKHYNRKGPAWEFLKHCRHAVAHSGRFRINKQIKHAARWRNLEILNTDHGKPLFDFPGEPGLLGPGDPLLLLWDLEQDLPELPKENV